MTRERAPRWLLEAAMRVRVFYSGPIHPERGTNYILFTVAQVDLQCQETIMVALQKLRHLVGDPKRDQGSWGAGQNKRLQA